MTNTDETYTSVETLFKRSLLIYESYQKKAASLPPHDLQLRRDRESALKKVLHMHRSLCLALGIEGGKSAEVNLERAAHALGLHGLQKKFRLIAHIANLLAEITAFVERYLEHEKQQKERIKALQEKEEASPPAQKIKKVPEKKQAANPQKADLAHTLREALDLQAQFQHSIEQLTQALQRYSGLAEFGLILNHLGGIKHPYSLFYSEKNVPTSLDKDQLEHQAKLARLMPHP